MPESKSSAIARAKREGFPTSNVVKGSAGHFISPHGVTSNAGKKTYASCRSDGGGKEKCAKIAWSVQKKYNGK